jgi:hypothetical protein
MRWMGWRVISACHFIGWHITQEPGVYNALDYVAGVAGNICQVLPCREASGVRT